MNESEEETVDCNVPEAERTSDRQRFESCTL